MIIDHWIKIGFGIYFKYENKIWYHITWYRIVLSLMIIFMFMYVHHSCAFTKLISDEGL